MAVQINVAGAAEIKIATDGSVSMSSLGYTQDGAKIIFRGYSHRIFADSRGGTEGQPRDYIKFCDTADIILRLTKYDPTVANEIIQRDPTGSIGAPALVGPLMMPTSGSWTYASRLLVNTSTGPYNFPRVLYLQPIEINRGTKFSELLVIATAHYDDYNGCLFNSTTS